MASKTINILFLKLMAEGLNNESSHLSFYIIDYFINYPQSFLTPLMSSQTDLMARPSLCLYS